jgi:hypothetical protein
MIFVKYNSMYTTVALVVQRMFPPLLIRFLHQDPRPVLDA